MTRFRYGFAVLLQSFGLVRKNKRMTEAAYELHLMQDGEDLLGNLCWRKVEHIEELSMQYWNLRKLEREQAEFVEKIEQAEITLQGAQNLRADAADRSKGAGQELVEERESLFDVIDKMNQQRNEIMIEAELVKRRYEALRMKAKVLKEEGSEQTEQFQTTRKELITLKETFVETREKLKSVDANIAEKDRETEAIQAQIDEKIKGTKGEAAETFSLISKANRDISSHKAQLGLLLEEQSRLFREVGHFLNMNSQRKDCREATRGHRGILEQVRVLRKSINWNRALVERVTA